MAYDAPGGRKPICSTWRAPYAEAKDFGTRYLAFERWLDDVIVVVKPGLVVFEAPMVIGGATGSTRVTNADTVRYLYGLAAYAEGGAARHAVECHEENIGTIKKFFAGHGRADKDAMRARCKMLGWEAANHNEADAAGLWAYAKSLIDPAFSYAVTPLGHDRG